MNISMEIFKIPIYDSYIEMITNQSQLSQLSGEPNYKENSSRPVVTELARGFLPGPLPLIREPPPIISKDTKRTQSSLVTM